MTNDDKGKDVNKIAEAVQAEQQPMQSQQIARVSEKLPPLWKNI